MRTHHRLTYLIALLAAILIPASAEAEQLTIRMPSYENGSHTYYKELLETALTNDGHRITIELVEDMPHLRERDMLAQGGLHVHWLIRSPARDKRYIPVPVNLTNGLIGKRVLLVARKDWNAFKDVKTLGDFRRMGMVGGFGKNWFDVGVWEANDLPYMERADWRLFYGMVADGTRGVDYFSRGFNEVVAEAEQNQMVAIEPHLMLVYERDFVFYVSPKFRQLAEILTKALTRARDSGIMDELIRKHWAKNFEIIRPEERTIIKLKPPE